MSSSSLPDRLTPIASDGSLTASAVTGLVAVLGEARSLGFLGPGPVEDHVRHATGFKAVAEEVLGGPPERMADLGSGGGAPGLVLAMAWPDTQVVLVESMQRRAVFLDEAIRSLGLGDRVSVEHQRAELVAREQRSSCDLVTARGFGPPAVTAECAAPLLRVGGCVVVSEPPTGADRWPDEVAVVGLRVVGLTEVADAGHFSALVLDNVVDDRYPRRVGIPAKRPLF